MTKFNEQTGEVTVGKTKQPTQIELLVIQLWEEMNKNNPQDIPKWLNDLYKQAKQEVIFNENTGEIRFSPKDYGVDGDNSLYYKKEDDIEKLESNYSKELAERRKVAINYKGQVAGRHPDLFGYSEMQHMIRGYLEGFEKANKIQEGIISQLKERIDDASFYIADEFDKIKETLYTEEQVLDAIEMAREKVMTVIGYSKKYSSEKIIQSLKQHK